MDHGQALATKASERYLLGEMTEPERFDFEGHYFSCEVCADDIRAGVALTSGIKAVCAADPEALPESTSSHSSPRRSWFDWLTPAAMAPSLAALAFAVLAGYQAFFLIPPLRQAVAPQATEPVVLRAVARGEEPAISIDRTGGLSVLAMDVNAGEPGQNLAYELLPPAGARALAGSAKVPPAGTQLLLVLPNATLHQPGAWTLVLRNPQGAETGRYPFRVEIK